MYLRSSGPTSITQCFTENTDYAVSNADNQCDKQQAFSFLNRLIPLQQNFNEEGDQTRSGRFLHSFLEVEPDLRREGARRHIVGPAEG